MDLASQQILNRAANVAAQQLLVDALAATNAIPIDGSIVAQDGVTLSISVGDATILRIRIADVVSIKALPNDEVQDDLIASGIPARVAVKVDAEVVMERILRIGKELTAPETGSIRACPPQCTSPVQCGAGCCCGGKKCRGRSCVD